MSHLRSCSASEIAAIISALTMVVGLFLSIWQMIRRIERKTDATRTAFLTRNKQRIEEDFAHDDKGEYVTLDYRMTGADGETICLRIPLSNQRATQCLMGLRLWLLTHNKLETVYSINTMGFHAPVRLHWHWHDERKTIKVVMGTMVDVQTGRRYGPGESWVLEPGVIHTADFDNAYCVATLRPPLPFASEKPIHLEGMTEVYDAEDPQHPKTSD